MISLLISCQIIQKVPGFMEVCDVSHDPAQDRVGLVVGIADDEVEPPLGRHRRKQVALDKLDPVFDAICADVLACRLRSCLTAHLAADPAADPAALQPGAR